MKRTAGVRKQIEGRSDDKSKQKLERQSNTAARLDEKFPDLRKEISGALTQGGAAHPRRQNEDVRTTVSVPQLRKKLAGKGIEVSKTSLFYRLQPANKGHTGAKKHIDPLPIRMLRATNDLHKSHDDWSFCRATIDNLREPASFFGHSDVNVISQDDRCRVNVGTPAVGRQMKVLTELANKTKLPDHDFPVAAKHKLIPSVYATLNVEAGKLGDKKAVTYKGEEIAWKFTT